MGDPMCKFSRNAILCKNWHISEMAAAKPGKEWAGGGEAGRGKQEVLGDGGGEGRSVGSFYCSLTSLPLNQPLKELCNSFLKTFFLS